MFSLSATLQSYTGVWGRVRFSVHSPPDPSRKTPYCLHLLSTRVFIWEPGELGGADDWAGRGRTLIIQLLLLTF